ncbi:unnamed protein product [Candidula unifasciata]|uniref:Uncharacterized protein n=1 Tax=Candidula unifasciata TaxID=100452 RepID=A0A8S3YWV6_9EUPU|nr:unnamed protein product [Candidula unifasciata]
MASARTYIVCLWLFVVLFLEISDVKGRRGGGGSRSSGRSSRSHSYSSSRAAKTYTSVALTGRVLGSSKYTMLNWRTAALAGFIYGGPRYIRLHSHRHDMPPICTNDYEKSPEGRIYGYFICPRENETETYIYCCGPNKREYCCDREMAQKYVSKSGLSIGDIFGIVFTVGFVCVLSFICFKKRKQPNGSLEWSSTVFCTHVPSSSPLICHHNLHTCAIITSTHMPTFPPYMCLYLLHTYALMSSTHMPSSPPHVCPHLLHTCALIPSTHMPSSPPHICPNLHTYVHICPGATPCMPPPSYDAVASHPSYDGVSGLPYGPPQPQPPPNLDGKMFPYPSQGGDPPYPYPQSAASAPYPPPSEPSYPLLNEQPYPNSATVSYPPSGGAPYPTPGGAPYPTPGGAPYPTPGGAPYPTPGGAPYPSYSSPNSDSLVGGAK